MGTVATNGRRPHRPWRSDHRTTWDRVLAFRLTRHHLAAAAPRRALSTVIRDMGGAQAQLMSAAVLSVCLRVEGLLPGDVRHAVTTRRLVRAACMRRTLFLVPASELAVFVRGSAGRAEKEMRWALNKGVSRRGLDAAIDAVLDNLREPRTGVEIVERVCRDLGVRPRRVEGGGWGNRRNLVAAPIGALHYPAVSLLSLAATRGVVCYGPDREGEPTFVRADAWLPAYREMEREDAEVRLLDRYLHAFGPATPGDFAQWAGVTLAEARRIWSALGAAIAPLDVDGAAAGLLRSDLGELSRADGAGRCVRLLPAFDTYLLGHRDRGHLAAANDLGRIYCPQGWVSPVLLLDGRAAGVWEHQHSGDVLTLTVRPFGTIPQRRLGVVRAEAERLARLLGAGSVDLRFG